MTLDAKQFRDALGQFATGIAIVTLKTNDNRCFGITINSFASVSLDPPLVLWSLQKSSELLEVFTVGDNFCINILGKNNQHLSIRYSDCNHQLDTEHFALSDFGQPVINDVLVSFDCQSEQHFDGGDHIILLSRVVDFSKTRDCEPLVFHAGHYCHLSALS